MRHDHRSHLWLHAALAVAVAAVLGLTAIGVAIPSVVSYLLVLACPLMMLVMMLGMKVTDQDDRQDPGDPVVAGEPTVRGLAPERRATSATAAPSLRTSKTA